MNARQFEVFLEIHKDIPREGPGDSEITKQIYAKCTELPDNPQILDIGCGPGFQTIDLAGVTNGKITALDYHEQYLHALNLRITELNLSDKISCIRGDMNNMKFDHESFDLIWSEGAVYIMGFGEGLKEWRKFVKSGGYLCVTELSWIKDNPPAEVADYWNENYPGMLKIDEANKIAARYDYDIIENIILPDSAWFENYYDYISVKFPAMKDKYSDEPEVLEVIANEEKEIEIRHKYGEFYGYVFYVLKRKD